MVMEERITQQVGSIRLPWSQKIPFFCATFFPRAGLSNSRSVQTTRNECNHHQSQITN